jgi:hypothetical protein
LAKTASGMEFYLVEATPSANVDSSEVEGLLRRNVRNGDPVFCAEGHVYVAFPADVHGAACATRRLLIMMRHGRLQVQTRLVPEPSSSPQATAVDRLASGEIPMSIRPPRDR